MSLLPLRSGRKPDPTLAAMARAAGLDRLDIENLSKHFANGVRVQERGVMVSLLASERLGRLLQLLGQRLAP